MKDSAMATFSESLKVGFSKGLQFNGRSSRSEFWYFYLSAITVGVVLDIVDHVMFPQHKYGFISLMFTLAILVPVICAQARRLHDIGRSSWWLLIFYTIIGIPILIYWFCQPGDVGANRFGQPDAA